MSDKKEKKTDDSGNCNNMAAGMASGTCIGMAIGSFIDCIKKQ